MEPRRWTHLPVGTNFADVSYVTTTGDIHFDPVVRIDNAEVDLHTAVVSYNRTFALGDMTARADVQLPIQSGRWQGLVDGVPRTVTRVGLSDPRIRLSVNFAGAPALEGEAFQDYLKSRENRTTAGAALAVRLPLGEYMDDKLINLGENRFSFQSQLGAVHTRGSWSFEVTGSVFLFTDNDEFFDGNRLEQDPLYSVQGHVVRTFEPGFWVSAGASYGWAAETKINGVSKDDDRSNLLYGLAFGFPLSSTHGFRAAYFRHDALEDVGADNHNILLSWGIRF